MIKDRDESARMLCQKDVDDGGMKARGFKYLGRPLGLDI